MPSIPIPHKGQRGFRVRLGGSILTLVVLENGREIRGRLSQLSVNGGLLSLEKPLDEGIRVTVVFHMGFSVRCRAQMMFPMWATQGCLQPFRFLELSEASRTGLKMELETLVRAGASQELEEESE
jgi:hypothetical protein